ncbi:receptor expression-enhancing protein 4 [Crucibulum laeve]|uniref:Protein YOP1 n=1 Tax=Crucibulum laeve TaxID=68775 RepID=A0A5C3LGE9_9AGAR|nr:receptor expression-enhancing protein 4 [Crucibulum laeve]
MLFYFTSRIISSAAAFLYPGYASYKTLSQRPASEEELERWLMYWSVLGCIVGVEYVAEWLISWIPFYYTMKTIFLLYLALPQTRGSSYLYVNHLEPFFRSHESQIDAALASFKAKVYAFLQERLRALWDHVAATVGQQQQQAAMNPSGGAINTGAPPSLSNPASGPAQLASSLWTSYGPSILASGTAFLRQATAGTSTTRPSAALNTPPTSYIRSEVARQSETRAIASETTAGQSAIPMPTASPQLFPSRNSSDSSLYLRERTISGKFEEIEIPSDVEGYDLGDKEDGASGHVTGRPSARGRNSSWFGGWSGSSKSGYERVKSD